MATSAVHNPVPATGESKSAKKRKGKMEAAVGPGGTQAEENEAVAKDSSIADGKTDGEASGEHPYLRELQKQIRNVNKKLSAMAKTDSIIAENPNVSLDDLVGQRKLNQDQKAAALKKPQLQNQVSQLEEQIQQHRKISAEYQGQLEKQKQELTAQHRNELAKAKESARLESMATGANELRDKLLIFSQFLRLAAAKRNVEEETDTDETKAFEGALLLVYGGDQKAVETALKLIEGSEEQVPSTESVPLPITYEQVRKAAVDHAPVVGEDLWDQSGDGTTVGSHPVESAPAGSDPTIAHAGMTELGANAQSNGISASDINPTPVAGDSGDGGNLAGERWNATAAGAEKGGLEDSYEIVPRPQDEVEAPISLTAPGTGKTDWADDAPVMEGQASGNQAGESWDMKAAGDQSGGWADGVVDSGAVPAEEGDGFHPVPGRQRGRGGVRGRGGEGDVRGRGRGRGGGFRGDGDSRGRGRGGGFRVRGEGGELRGRGGGRGRGPRGGADGQTRGS